MLQHNSVFEATDVSQTIRESDSDAPACAQSPAPRFSLDQPLIRLENGHARQAWTLRHACENCQIFGRIGSGKTSGSGNQIARAFVASGYGGLVLSAKPTDLDQWTALCKAAGRARDLLVVDASGATRFNFMDYELRRNPDASPQIANITNLLTQLSELQRPPTTTSGNDEFWRSNLDRLINNALQVAVAADGHASLARIEELIVSAASTPQEARSSTWRARSALGQALETIHANEESQSESEIFDIQRAFDYWYTEYPAMDDRTRANILAAFQGVTDRFLRGAARRMFCTDITVLPEMTHYQGRIIFLNLPIAEFGTFGRMAQVLFKYVWQQATLRRQDQVDDTTRPVFLWIDESQEFVTSSDSSFLNRCRDSRACTVFLTQSLPNYVARIGRDATQSLLGSFNTKIFHSLACAETARYATELIGQTLTQRASYRRPNEQPEFGLAKTEMSFSDTMDYPLQPRDFYALRAGGPQNDLLVDAVMVQGGRTWPPHNSTFVKWTMRQDTR